MKEALRILYHVPVPFSIYAQRTIVAGYCNAFTELGHEFKLFGAGDNLRATLESFRPHLFITGSNYLYRRHIDLDELQAFRKEGVRVFCQLDAWRSPFSATRINEARSLSDDKATVELIGTGRLADFFYQVMEQDDERMSGFAESTGYQYTTIPLAADATLQHCAVFDQRFAADISYVGTNLPDKRKFFREVISPLKSRFDIKLYGQDWTASDRALGWVQRAGQFFNVPLIRSLRRPKLALADEYSIYASSKICINVHEAYQRQFGGDCNERTFKIGLAGALQICDRVAAVNRYFSDNEIVIVGDDKQWRDAFDYYTSNDDEARAIASRANSRVLSDHTYHHRAAKMLQIFDLNT